MRRRLATLGLCLATSCAAERPEQAVPAPPRPARPPVVLATKQKPPPPSPLDLFLIEPADLGTGPPKGVPHRVGASPHAFFRFSRLAFDRAMCIELKKSIDTMPTVVLHGDATLEAYRVSAFGRGLERDRIEKGPPMFDVVRMLASLALFDAQPGFEGAKSRLQASFLRGYAQGVETPDAELPVPSFARSAAAHLANPGSQKRIYTPPPPADPVEAQRLFDALHAQLYVAIVVHPKNKQFDFGIFDLVQLSDREQGLSLQKPGYVARTRGRTASDKDDLELEIIPVDIESAPCLSLDPKAAPTDLEIAPYVRDRYGSRVLMSGEHWVRQRPPESVFFYAKGAKDPDEVEGLAFEAGVLIGREHLRTASEDSRPRLRLDEAERARATALADHIAKAVTDAWERYRAALR